MFQHNLKPAQILKLTLQRLYLPKTLRLARFPENLQGELSKHGISDGVRPLR